MSKAPPSRRRPASHNGHYGVSQRSESDDVNGKRAARARGGGRRRTIDGGEWRRLARRGGTVRQRTPGFAALHVMRSAGAALARTARASTTHVFCKRRERASGLAAAAHPKARNEGLTPPNPGCRCATRGAFVFPQNVCGRAGGGARPRCAEQRSGKKQPPRALNY